MRVTPKADVDSQPQGKTEAEKGVEVKPGSGQLHPTDHLPPDALSCCKIGLRPAPTLACLTNLLGDLGKTLRSTPVRFQAELAAARPAHVTFVRDMVGT